MTVYADLFPTIILVLLVWELEKVLARRMYRFVKDWFCGSFGIHWCRKTTVAVGCGLLGCFNCRQEERPSCG